MRRALFTLVCFASVAAAQPSRDNAWRQDLDQLATQLPRLHPNLFYYSPRAVFDREVAALRDDIPSLPDTDVMVGLAAIVALAHDGHTSLSLNQRSAAFRMLPLQFKWLADGLFVTGTTEPYTRAAGARVIRIGDRSAEEAHEAVRRIVSHENDPFAREVGGGYLANADVLRALRIAPSADSVRLELRDRSGETFAMEVAATSPGHPVNGTAYPKRAEGFVPLYQQNTDQNYWFTYLESSRTLYFAYNRCVETPGLPFTRFNDQLWETFDTRPVDRFIFDLRNNGGGNSAILAPFLQSGQARAARLARLRVALITGRRTYSSGLINAIDLHNGPTVSYGEPTGNDASHYGQVATLALANSGLAISHSTRHFSYPTLPSGPLMPDVTVPIYSSDYFARHDPVVAAILADVSPGLADSGTMAVVNAASFRGPVAPDSIASAFGEWGEGVDVSVNGVAATVFGNFPGQVNFHVPASTRPGLASIRIGQQSGAARVVESAPGLFVAVVRGRDIEIYGTGQGAGAVSVFVGKDLAEVTYSGAHPAFPGLWQLNVRAPDSVLAGEVPVFAAVGGAASNAVVVLIKD
jgi:hypothetical protein